MGNPASEQRAAFQTLLRGLAPHMHRYDVFRDFIIVAACSLHNAVQKDDGREAEYMDIIGRYGPEDQQTFPKLMALLVAMLDPEPRDILGPLYMELEVASRDQGQFFTPPEVSNLMAEMTWSDQQISDRPFVTLQEPACGAGGMVLAFVKSMIDRGHDPSQKLWTQCIDVDRLAALMAYVQLSLWHVPGEILVGNTLSWEHRESWLTPAHMLGNWSAKLAARDNDQVTTRAKEPATASGDAVLLEAPAQSVAPDQMTFDFGGGAK